MCDMSDGLRAAGRIPMPDLDRIREDANHALCRIGLALCVKVEPVADGDTMNPQVIGHADGPQYVIKVVYPDATSWHHKDHHAGMRAANALRERTQLPIPQHYCVLDEEGRLPLVIMEFMAGEQLLGLLQRASEEQCRAVCEDWGRCIALFHSPALFDLLDDPSVVAQETEYDDRRARSYLAQHTDSRWHRDNADRILAYLNDRLPMKGKCELPALTKHGLDVRDFVAKTEPTPHISGMLDWEGIATDDGLIALVGIWVRLHYLSVGYAAPSFLAAYEKERGIALHQSRRVEFHLMNRVLLPTNHNAPARAIVEDLLNGAEYPFARRMHE